MTETPKRKVHILDTTLRDGSYAVKFSFTPEDTRELCKRLDDAGFEFIEVGHGVGLNGSSEKHGVAKASDEAYMAAAQEGVTNAKYGMFCIPGIARLDDIDLAKKHKMGFIRIGTDVDKVNSSESFIKKSKDAGMFVAANYMKSYTMDPIRFAENVLLSEKWGVDMVYVVDSAGGMFPARTKSSWGVKDYCDAIRMVSKTPIGFHGHNNFGIATANSLHAIEAGADFVDSSLQGLGRSAGNAVTEHLLAALKKQDYDVAPDLLKTLYVGRDYVSPIVSRIGKPRHSPLDVICGYADFHSSYMPHIQHFAAQYNADPLLLIMEYSKMDKLGMKTSLLEDIAKRFKDTNRQSLDKFDFGAYVGSEQEEN